MPLQRKHKSFHCRRRNFQSTFTSPHQSQTAMPPPHPPLVGLNKRNEYSLHTAREKRKGSLFRLLSPRAGTTSRSDVPSLTLHVANYGSILIQCTDDAFAPSRPDIRSRSTSSHTPGNTTSITPIVIGAEGDAYVAPPTQTREFELAGTLEIAMPAHLGKRRVRSIKIGMDATTRLDMGSTRGWEEDTIFNRRVEIRGAHGAEIILEPGTHL